MRPPPFQQALRGAEYNVAVGLRRSGHEAGYLTRLGRTPSANGLPRRWRKNGLDLSLVSYSRERATGFMLKAKSSLGTRIYSISGRIQPPELDEASIDRLDMRRFPLFGIWTGIFPALSEQTWSARFACWNGQRKPPDGVFDPNLRPQLWKDKALMCRRINLLARKADYFLPGTGEGRF